MNLNYRSRSAGVSTLCLGLLVVSAGLLLSLSGAPAWAQSSSAGTVSGLVTDQSNAVVVGAEVTLIDTATNTSKTITTNETGRYIFVNLAPGVYDITVSRAGFKLAKFPKQTVSVGVVLTVNATLEVGSPTTVVEVVSGAGTELQTMNATVGTTISGKHLEMLTNLGRDANALFVLQPAVTPNGNVAGVVTDQNTYLLDGGNNSSDMDGTQNVYTQAAGFIGSGAAGGTPSGVLPTPAESIEEFKVATNNQTADFNGSAGGQIQMVTKRGTNRWHGSAYEYYFGSNFGANTWSNNRSRTPLPSSHQNRFGASGGGPIAPTIWGGKTYLFVNYEGRRFPQVTTIAKPVPSALLRKGVIQVPDSTGEFRQYNLTATAVTVGGATYLPATCGSTNVPCDPRGLGLNPVVSEIWDKYMPEANVLSCAGVLNCDRFNPQGYRSAIRLPQNSDFGVARIDHDFGPKWRFMASYRVYTLTQLANTQVDIGGALPGGALGRAVAKAPRAQKPSYYVVGLTTSITPRLTNDLRWSYLRNFWEWNTAQAPPQPSSFGNLGGALEIGGESANALIPYNVNAQNARQRFWDGQDHVLRDDLSLIRGNHLFQFGGLYQRNFDFHQRNDNGQSTMTSTTYVIQGGSAVSGLTMGDLYRPRACTTAITTDCLPSGQNNAWDNLYAQVLGLVTLPQVVYSRSGANLALQPLGTPAFDKSIIPSYNVYFGDTWRMRPTLTLTYGLGYMVEMPPFELEGKQVMLVDVKNSPITTEDYLAQRKNAALAGKPDNPVLGFATLRNVGKGLKYPYHPYYGGLSPRVAAAWNPRFEHGILGRAFGPGRTVIRGGWNRIFGRLNGVDLVLVPLLGTGLLQTVSCEGAVRADFADPITGSQCLQAGGADPNSAFRIGPASRFDGMTAPLPTASQTLAQPYFPGVNRNAPAGDGSALDPNFRPNRSDQFDLTIQRELLPNKLLVEVGYIGRRIQNEWQMIDLDAVPHMTTLGGQTFAKAFANVYTALCGLGPKCADNSPSVVQTQPWFEAAMGGAGAGGQKYCDDFATCTAAVVARNLSIFKNAQVYNLWANLSTGFVPGTPPRNLDGWTLGRTLAFSPTCSDTLVSSINPTTPVPVCAQLRSIFMNTSLGHGNYNAVFVSLTARDWHHLTARSNFTWGRALGTGAEVQSRSSRSIVDPWDLDASYGPQDFDIRFLYNQSLLYEPPFFKGRKDILGQLLGGWAIAPLFTARSGSPLRVTAGPSCQAFGEMNCSSGSSWENAVLTAPYTGGNSAYYGISGSAGVGTNSPGRINMFTDPAAVYSGFRRLILGIDHRGGAAGPIRGLPTWNLDLSVAKKFTFTERMGMTFSAQFANVLNHFQPDNPSMNINSPESFGVINGQANTPRQIEFGLRIHF